MKDLKIIVYEMQTDKISPIGMIQDYISLSYTNPAISVGSFILVIPYTEDNLNLLSRYKEKEKIVLFDGILGIAYKVMPQKTKSGKTIKVQGTLIKGILSNFAIGLVNRFASATSAPGNLLDVQSSIAYEIGQLKTKSRWWNAIDFKTVTTDSSWVLSDGFQGGRTTLDELMEDVCRLSDKKYDMYLDQDSQKIVMEMGNCINRSFSQKKNPEVILSTSLGDIQESEYYLNSQDYKNVIYAYSSFKYNDQDEVIEMPVTYDEYTTPSNIPITQRREFYSQVEIQQEDGMSLQDISKLVRQEGKKILYDKALIKSYSCKLSENSQMFKFGTDYFLGDTVSVYDGELGIEIEARLEEYTKTYSSSGYTFEPSFGFAQPSITRMLKRKGVI